MGPLRVLFVGLLAVSFDLAAAAEGRLAERAHAPTTGFGVNTQKQPTPRRAEATVSASWTTSPGGTNFWDPTQFPNAVGADPAWGNRVADSASNIPISDTVTEFGWSASQGGPNVWYATLDVSTSNQLTVSIAFGNAAFGADFGSATYGITIVAQSDAFKGNNAIVPGASTLGQDPTVLSVDPATGIVTINIPQITIPAIIGVERRSATWQLEQVMACTPNGICCDATGQYVDAGTTCRPAAGPCDVAEVCNGTSALCPPDVFAPSGHACSMESPCTGPEGHCNGKSGACQPTSLKPDGSRCHWAPPTGPFALSQSVAGGDGGANADAKDQGAKLADAATAAALLAAAGPQYSRSGHGWPECVGTCLVGRCLLATPADGYDRACCIVSSSAGGGSSNTDQHFCW